MSDIADAFLSHVIPCRVRLKIPSKKGDLLYFKSLKEQISKYEYIEKVEVNHVSGSVLIIHKTKIEKIAEYAKEKNIFNLKSNKQHLSNFNRTVSKAFEDINRKVKKFTGGDIDIGGIAFLILIGVGFYQISRGNFAAPAWYTAFWYALNIFLKSKDQNGE